MATKLSVAARVPAFNRHRIRPWSGDYAATGTIQTLAAKHAVHPRQVTALEASSATTDCRRYSPARPRTAARHRRMSRVVRMPRWTRRATTSSVAAPIFVASGSGADFRPATDAWSTRSPETLMNVSSTSAGCPLRSPTPCSTAGSSYQSRSRRSRRNPDADAAYRRAVPELSASYGNSTDDAPSVASKGCPRSVSTGRGCRCPYRRPGGVLPDAAPAPYANPEVLVCIAMLLRLLPDRAAESRTAPGVPRTHRRTTFAGSGRRSCTVEGSPSITGLGISSSKCRKRVGRKPSTSPVFNVVLTWKRCHRGSVAARHAEDVDIQQRSGPP